MRILLVSEARTYHVQRWSASLAKRGHQVWVLSQSEQPIEGVEVIPLQTPRWGFRYRGRWRDRLASYIGNVVGRVGADVVHMHFLENYPITSRYLSGAKFVISTWGSDVVPDMPGDVEPAGARAAKAALLRGADRVTATTRFLAERTAEYGGLRLGDIAVIPFGVDLARFQPRRRNVERTAPRVIFLKHLYPKYGPDVFLESLPKVLAAQPETRVSMVGEGPMLASLQDQARRLGVADAIDWHGAVPHAHVPRLLAEHDVYVMPSVSESETFGVSAVEAQAAEVPVVFSDLPGVREAIEEGIGGIGVTPGDVDALAEAILELLADRELAERMGRAGRQFVAERLNWEDNVSAMEAVYRKVIS